MAGPMQPSPPIPTDLELHAPFQALHTGDGEEELSEVPRLCLYATILSLLINLPRR